MIKKIIQLFSKKKEMPDIELHSAGATIRAKTPFRNLETFTKEFEMDQQFIEKWVSGFYFNGVASDLFRESFKNVKDELNEEIVEILLGDFNWRTRTVGAHFTAIKKYAKYETVIGNHLLKSEVCYAGATYAVVLAFFNTEKARDYLIEYLNYYLKQTHLFFDQITVMNVLAYLDHINETNFHQELIPLWKNYSKKRELDEERYDLKDFEWLEDNIEAYKNMGQM